MAHCFTLTLKGDQESSKLSEIDDEMRVHFRQPPSANSWLWNWYYTIGIGLALGQNWEQLRETFYDDDETLKIIEYLEERFYADHWREK